MSFQVIEKNGLTLAVRYNFTAGGGIAGFSDRLFALIQGEYSFNQKSILKSCGCSGVKNTLTVLDPSTINMIISQGDKNGSGATVKPGFVSFNIAGAANSPYEPNWTDTADLHLNGNDNYQDLTDFGIKLDYFTFSFVCTNAMVLNDNIQLYFYFRFEDSLEPTKTN